MSTLGPSRSAKSTVRPQPNNACDVVRRSLPDGAFGMVPGSSTTTLRDRTVTSETTAWTPLVLDAAHSMVRLAPRNRQALRRHVRN